MTKQTRPSLASIGCMFAVLISTPAGAEQGGRIAATRIPHARPAYKSSENPWKRAGNPQRVAWYAVPSPNRHESAGYVGGGAAWRGEPRTRDEGTWGLDYSGALVKKRIWLDWWHGRHEQGGGGSYKTDGPKLLHREK